MSEPSPEFAPAGLFENLFDDAPCGYVCLAPSGRILLANRTLAGWLGRPKATLEGVHLRELLSVPGRIFYETNVAPMLRLSGGFEELALDLLTPSGAKLAVLANGSEQRGPDGEPVSIRLALFRARNRRDYERDLQAREAEAVSRLATEQELSRLREQFIAVLGHDLRNPLASVVGGARILRREGQSEKALKIIELMEASVDRMAGLIDDVMDFARGRLGSGISLLRRIEPLEPVLRQVVDELAASQPSRVIACDICAPGEISFDRGRLAQLVSNLLGNALTHGDPTRPVALKATVEDGVLRVALANAGAPIPPAVMERLFQPFFRGEVRPSQQGLGLGLHIASEIARAHGGRIEVSSTEAETVFTFVMPLLVESIDYSS